MQKNTNKTLNALTTKLNKFKLKQIETNAEINETYLIT